jgi:hypothetical protein
LANGVALDCLVFDEGYGCTEFLAKGRRPRRGWAGKRADRLIRAGGK